MSTPIQVHTERLILRQWRTDDRAPLAALNADPQVMACFPALLTRAQSDAMAECCEALIAERGWGFWALERRDTGEFIGFTGLHEPADTLSCAPCVEIGWRLASAHWGQGLAFEAAQAALTVGFERLGLDEIVAFTATGNTRSLSLMQRLGMRPAGEFDHPALAEDSPLRRHRLFRLARTAFTPPIPGALG